MKVRIKKLPQQHELNSRHWKHGLGGNLFDGISEDTQQMQVAKPDATYVARTPIFPSISKKEYDWEDAALSGIL